MPRLIVLFCICVWLLPSILLWKFANWLRSTAGPGEVASWAFFRGVAIGCLVAPSIVSGGYAAVPAPAVIALLASVFAQHIILWGQFFMSLGSLVVCSLIAFAIMYGSAKS